MRPTTNRTRAIAIAVALAAVGGGAVSVADGAGDPSSAAPPPGSPIAAPTSAAQPDRAALAQARANVGALRQPRQPATDAIAKPLADGPLGDGIVALGSTRSVTAAGERGWLASTSDGTGICAIAAGAATCPPVEQVVDEGLSAGYVTRAGAPVHVFGVVSDAVGDVALLLRDGTSQDVAVAENFFAVETAAVPIEIRWIGPDGYRSFTFPTRPGIGGVPAAP